MPVYAYKGLNERGKEVKGLLDADSPRVLRTQLKKQGVRIVEHREEDPNKKSSSGLLSSTSTEIDLSRYFERITVADIALVTRQLATLIRSGIPLIEALGAIVDQVEGAKLKRIFGQVKTQVNEGMSLADAMGQHRDVFDDLYVSMVRAGEASGALDKVLSRLADFTEAQAALRSQIQNAMFYPVIMLGIGSLIMVILFVVVIPRITKIFEQVRAELPPQTQFLIFTANLIKGYWFILFPLIGLMIYGFMRWKASPAGRPWWDRFVLRAPIFGPVVRLVSIARFARTLATLLRSGVPVLNALDITKDVLNNHRLSDVVSDAREAIREGDSIAAPLKKSGEFPPIVVHMIATGEKSGQLEEMLEHVADNYDFQVDQRVEQLTTLIEPIMIIGMGVGVAFIVFSILLPILQLSQHVR
ncbi:MAG: type II secretion system inner membrane protein GspF [Myxococcota bacterium]